jgi:ADP-ribosylglycohydrolase
VLGAIAGDVVGSVHEFRPLKSKDFPLVVDESEFTDDTVLTVAVAHALLDGLDYVDALHDYVDAYPGRGYGGRFHVWALSRLREPYHSYGNGSAMRVSPVAYAFDSLDDVLEGARASAAVTHDHPEGVRGAQAVAAAIWLARTGADKNAIRREVSTRFGYDLDRTVGDIRPDYRFDETCQGSVPESIVAFLDSHDFEDAIRNAISLGGDADTMACIAGSIAEPFYGGVPKTIAESTLALLDHDLRRIGERFRAAYPCPR